MEGRKLNVYLAEDEEWIRRGLKKMIDWEGIGLTLVGEAGDGLLARQEIETREPDIVLADIRMPGLDGLSMARELKGKIKARVIFISGYKEFEYARQAVELEAWRYLIKPVDKDELNRILGELAGEVRSKEEKKEKEEARRRMMEILESKGQTEEARGYYSVLLILDSLSERDGESIGRILEKYKKKGLMGECCSRGKEEYVVIFAASDKERLIRLSPACVEELRTAVQAKRGWSLGDAVSGMNQIPSSYRHAWMAFAYQGLNRKETVIVYQPSMETKMPLPTLAQAERLWSAVETGEEERAAAEAEKIVEELSGEENTGILAVADGIFYLCLELNGRMQKAGIGTTSYYESCREFFLDRRQFREIKNLKQWTVEFVVKLCGAYQRARKKTMEMAVLRVKEYIDSHYGENITLTAMADMVFVSPAYLSSCFKQTAGENFSCYLKKRRMQAAVEYLANTKKGVGEISLLVGYDNVRHFSKTFFREMGQTPTQFRGETQKKGDGKDEAKGKSSD